MAGQPSHGIWKFIQWLSANQNGTNFMEISDLISKVLQNIYGITGGTQGLRYGKKEQNLVYKNMNSNEKEKMKHKIWRNNIVI